MLMNGKASGKCSLEDTVEMYVRDEEHYEEDVEKFLENTVIYTNMDQDFHMINPLKLKTYKDILPYYPRCESIMCSSDGKRTILLQNRPHWAYEERDRLEWDLKDALKIYNRLKRKKEPISKEVIMDGIWGNHSEKEEIVDRVIKYGKKAKIDDMHCASISSLYRKPFIDELIRVGYTEEQATKWVFDEIKTWEDEL